MKVNSIEIEEFTVFDKLKLDFSPNINIITGLNGVGKTEPFQSNISKTDIVYGKIEKSTALKIVSQMPENGVIFSDGIEDDFLVFNSGIKVDITLGERKGKLVN